MVEQRLRELEQTYSSSPTTEAGAELLLERMRSGLLPRHELQLLAHMGDASARQALELPAERAFAYETVILDGEGQACAVGGHELFEPEEGWERVANWGVQRYWLRPLKVSALRKPELFREVAGVLLARPIDSHFRSVAAFPSLRWLAARDGAKLSDKGVAHLAGLALEGFELSNCPGVTTLSGLDGSKLVALALLGSPIESLAELGPLPRLEEFALRGGSCTDAALAFLSQASGLRSLRLSELPKVTSLSVLADLAQLEHLDLSGSTGLAPDALEALRGHERLRSLDLRDCPSVRNAIADLELPRLERLDLRPEGDRVPGLRGLLERLPELRSLELRGPRQAWELDAALSLARALGVPDVEVDGVPPDSFLLARSPNNRARCLHCAHTITKGSYRAGSQRVVTFREDSGGLKPAYLHPLCAAEFYGLSPERTIEIYRRANDAEDVEEAFRWEPELRPEAPSAPALPTDEAVAAARKEVGPLLFCFERVESALEGEFFRVRLSGPMAQTAAGSLGGEPRIAGNLSTFNQIAGPMVQRGFRLLGNLSEGADMLARLQDDFRARRASLGSYALRPYAGEALTALDLLQGGPSVSEVEHLERLGEDRFAHRVRALAVDAAGPELFARLAAIAPQLSGLRVLRLPAATDPARVLELWPELLHLECGAGSTPLASERLRSLTLSNLGPECARALGESGLPSLELLQLQAPEPADPELPAALAAARELRAPYLQRLSLKGKAGTRASALDPLLEHLAEAPWFRQLHALDLVGGLTSAGLPALEALAPLGIARLRVAEHSSKWKRGSKKRLRELFPQLDWD